MTIFAIGAFFVPAARAFRSANERGDLLELQRAASVVASRVPATGPIDQSVLDPIVDSADRLGLYAPDGHLLGGTGPRSADRMVGIALGGDFAEGRVGDDLVAAVPVRVARRRFESRAPDRGACEREPCQVPSHDARVGRRGRRDRGDRRGGRRARRPTTQSPDRGAAGMGGDTVVRSRPARPDRDRRTRRARVPS